jgi:hypothetical protein
VTSDRETRDPAASLVLPARPRWRSLDPAPTPLPLHRRLALLLLLAALHLLLFRALDFGSRVALPRSDATITRVLLLDLPPEASVPLPNPRRPPPRVARERAAPPPVRPARTARRPRSAPPDPVPGEGVASTPPPPAARLFRADGSIELPDTVNADLERVTSPERVYSYQIPGLAQARSFAQRAAPLDYVPTRFDAHWEGDKDALSEWLEKAVEKSTATITIPIPRSPGSKIVCKVSLLAAGGACGIVRNDAGYLVLGNDPETLNAEEDARCQAWWSEVAGARTYEQWRAMHDRYEAACKQPLEDVAAVPSA